MQNQKHLKVMQQVGLSLPDVRSSRSITLSGGERQKNQAGEEPGKKRTYYCDGRADNRPAYVGYRKSSEACLI